MAPDPCLQSLPCPLVAPLGTEGARRFSWSPLVSRLSHHFVSDHGTESCPPQHAHISAFSSLSWRGSILGKTNWIYAAKPSGLLEVQQDPFFPCLVQHPPHWFVGCKEQPVTHQCWLLTPGKGRGSWWHPEKLPWSCSVPEICTQSLPATLQVKGSKKCQMQADEEHKPTAPGLLIDLITDQASKQGQVIAK